MTRSWFAASLLVCLIAMRAQAQMLPLRHYTTSDGLAHNVVTSLYEDSRGYLWIGTVEGASRFDGEEIVTYGRRHALPSSLVTGFLETPDQQLWLATSPTDVFRFDERAFTFERVTIASEPGAHRVLTLAVTDHALWAATDAGLYRRPFSPAGGVFERVLASDDAENAGPSLTDSRGRVWIGLRHRLLLLTDTAREVHALPTSPERPNDIVAILEDARGGLAVVSLQGVSRRPGDAAPFAGVPLPLAAGEQIYAGVMTDLGTLGGPFSRAFAINNHGDIAGHSLNAAGEMRAVLWRDGTMIDLGTLGGGYAIALAINNRGEIVGEAETATGAVHAFVWRNGVMVDLGALP